MENIYHINKDKVEGIENIEFKIDLYQVNFQEYLKVSRSCKCLMVVLILLHFGYFF